VWGALRGAEAPLFHGTAKVRVRSIPKCELRARGEKKQVPPLRRRVRSGFGRNDNFLGRVRSGSGRSDTIRGGCLETLLSYGAVAVFPAALKEAVTHHALAEQKEDDRQDSYKQQVCNSDRGWLPSVTVRRLHFIPP